MEKNIFEGAKFGSMFLTRDGNKVMFIHYIADIDAYHCVAENWYDLLDYAPDGKAYTTENHPTDIVSRYQEPINEEKLDDEISLLQSKAITEATEIWIPQHKLTMYPFDEQSYIQGIADGVDYGYRKAKEV